MVLDATNLGLRFIIAVCFYFLLEKLIDVTVKDPSSNQIFKVVLLIVCLLFVFFGSLLIRF